MVPVVMATPDGSSSSSGSTTNSNNIPEKMMIVGGYSTVTEPELNSNVMNAARYAVKNLLHSSYRFVTNNREVFDKSISTSTTTTTTTSTTSTSTKDDENTMITFQIIEASQQVVAGMNYKIWIAVLYNRQCIGSFVGTVYDQFGTLSVTNWGTEISCSEVEHKLQHQGI